MTRRCAHCNGSMTLGLSNDLYSDTVLCCLLCGRQTELPETIARRAEEAAVMARWRAEPVHAGWPGGVTHAEMQRRRGVGA